MKRRTERMDRPNQSGGIFRIDVGVDSMAEIEYMAGPLAIAGEHPSDLLTDASRRGVEDAGV